MIIIEVSGLSKSFGDFMAVKGISFEVRQGEVFGFLGPNGAGKTTTINMLTGLAKPTAGTIKISGHDGIGDIKKVQRIIGIVPDESNLYDDLSGFENLVFCAFLNILKKDRQNYYLKPPNISWGIIFPISWTLMFFVRSATDVDIRSILPGVMALSVLFGTTSMLAVTITFERKSRSFERLLLAPISLNLLMLAKTTGAILFGIINAFIPVLFASFLADLSGIDWFSVIAAVVLIALTSTFLGLFIAVSVSEVFEAQTFSNFFRFPMMFLCGLFIPIENLPIFIRPLSYVLPLTYGVDILKQSINQSGHIQLWLSLIVLIGFAAGLFLISTSNIKKRWIY